GWSRSSPRVMRSSPSVRCICPARAGCCKASSAGDIASRRYTDRPRPPFCSAVMRTAFVKMHGLGNDFVILDLRRRELALDAAAFGRLADRRFGVGCDQVLVLVALVNARAHVRYRVVNADGSPAEHCGNGVRCVARYLERLGEVSDKVVVEIGS